MEFIGRLPFEFVAPAQVAAEIDTGRRLGHRITMPEWISIATLERPVGALGQSTLDAGEAAVIELAIERGISLVAIDEARGRRAAAAAGLNVIGSLGLLRAGKACGLVPAVAPYVRAMQNAGVYLSDALVQRFLASVSEGPLAEHT